MQLLAAHQILIGSAIALAVLFGLRSLVHFSHGGTSADLVLAAASLVAAAAPLYRHQLVIRPHLAEVFRRNGRGREVDAAEALG